MERSYGNIFVRDNGSPHQAGWRMDGHEHNFDHVTYVVKGRYRATLSKLIVGADGKPLLRSDGQKQFTLDVDREFGPGSMLLVRAENRHSFECVEGPGVLHCVYAHRDPQTGEVVQQYNGWEDAYR